MLLSTCELVHSHISINWSELDLLNCAPGFGLIVLSIHNVEDLVTDYERYRAYALQAADLRLFGVPRWVCFLSTSCMPKNLDNTT